MEENVSKSEQQVAILTEITQRSQQTECIATEDGGLVLSFIVIEGGQPVVRHMVVGAPGKKTIGDAVLGGITVAQQVPKL